MLLQQRHPQRQAAEELLHRVRLPKDSWVDGSWDQASKKVTGCNLLIYGLYDCVYREYQIVPGCAGVEVLQKSNGQEGWPTEIVKRLQKL